MTCECRKEVEAKISRFNTRVKSYFCLAGNTVALPWPIETEQIEKGRGKPKAKVLFASFCPFCGESLHDEDKPRATGAATTDGENP